MIYFLITKILAPSIFVCVKHNETDLLAESSFTRSPFDSFTCSLLVSLIGQNKYLGQNTKGMWKKEDQPCIFFMFLVHTWPCLMTLLFIIHASSLLTSCSTRTWGILFLRSTFLSKRMLVSLLFNGIPNAVCLTLNLRWKGNRNMT